jgi:hypothetical protein
MEIRGSGWVAMKSRKISEVRLPLEAGLAVTIYAGPSSVWRLADRP